MNKVSHGSTCRHNSSHYLSCGAFPEPRSGGPDFIQKRHPKTAE
jgi:hypothetical protein